MNIGKLIEAHKKEKDRNVADRILLIIFIKRDKMYVTEAAPPPQQGQVAGHQVASPVSGEWDGRTAEQAKNGQAAEGPSGHYEEGEKAGKKDRLLGGRRGA